VFYLLAYEILMRLANVEVFESSLPCMHALLTRLYPADT
jgi:hypothetical protein